ncbi:MAG TPA: ATP-binding protein [Pirellulales bacterium]|nr:ATP-binding protein [Pirellulales bacterium]
MHAPPDPRSLAALEARRLRWHCDPAQFTFNSTDELEDLADILGQQRALEAIRFSVGIRREGYHLYVQGPPGIGKRTVVQQILKQRGAAEAKPSDWCYVNNFGDPQKPLLLQLPAGRGSRLREEMTGLVDDLRTAVPAALQSEEHRTRLQEVEREFESQHERAFKELEDKAEAQGVKLLRTPTGFAMAPLHNGEVVGPEEFEKLTDDEKRRIEQVVAVLQEELRQVIEQVPKWRKEAIDKVKELTRETTRFAIRHLLDRVKQSNSDLPDVLRYLDAVERDVLAHSGELHASEEAPPAILGMPLERRPFLRRYQLNLLVDNAQTAGAPVVYEDHPTYQNLIGRVEHISEMGALVTDFNLIKPGALHRANGGYLIIDMLNLLAQPYAWEGLKRALHSHDIRIESLGQALSLTSTVSLEPQPVPLDIKIVLIGDRLLYYLLFQYDPDFAELFKVGADFDDQIDRNGDNCRLYARLVATLVHREKLRPFDPTGVACVLEHAARLAGDAEKLSIHLRSVVDLVSEADYWASQQGSPQVTESHVERAIDEQIHRADRLRQRVHEEIARGTLLIDTEGAKVGQVNGLSVIDLGNFAFGHPSRVTATVRLGKGDVIDIEREVKLGGAIHSKGVLILGSFLASRYARKHPLSLSASLVFEQSYGMVDGDSASVGELCALASALAEVPLKQSLAITGSVNQHGQVQAIGGVNEKIEGFFDVCAARGLTGEQGVIIPASNVKHLMLRKEVVAAAAAGRFRVYAVDTIDEAVTLLTGMPAGERAEAGDYPPGSVNRLVEDRLVAFSGLRQKFAEPSKSEAQHD